MLKKEVLLDDVYVTLRSDLEILYYVGNRILTYVTLLKKVQFKADKDKYKLLLYVKDTVETMRSISDDFTYTLSTISINIDIELIEDSELYCITLSHV